MKNDRQLNTQLILQLEGLPAQIRQNTNLCEEVQRVLAEILLAAAEAHRTREVASDEAQ